MGGKPGQSRGCGTCRRRKKGCDQMRPVCGQCLKSNLTCTGYDKPPNKWVDQQPQESRSSSSAALLAVHKEHAAHMVLLPKIPSSLETSASRMGWYGSFMEHWEPKTPEGARVEMFMRGGWITDMPRLAVEDPLIACAFDALSLIRLGNLSRDKAIVARSEVEYGKAIRVVRARLLDPEQISLSRSTSPVVKKESSPDDGSSVSGGSSSGGSSNSSVGRRSQSPAGHHQAQLKLLLSVVLLLGQYEIMSASREKAVGWMSHTQAALALHSQFVADADDDEYTELVRKFRAALRTDGIIRAISQRNPKLLIPQLPVGHPMADGGKLDILYRMMEEIPFVLQKTEALMKTPKDGLLMAALEVADSAASVFAQFDAWRQLQETVVIDTGYWYEDRISHYHQSRNEDVVRQCIWFSDVETATAYTIAWSGMLNLCITHCTTARWLATALSPSDLALLSAQEKQAQQDQERGHIFLFTNLSPILREAALCVRNINLSLDYFLQPSIGSLTGRIVGFPLALSMGFEIRGPKGEVSPQTSEALQVMRERDGVPMDTFLYGMHAAADTRPRHDGDIRGSKSRLAT